MPAVTEPDSPRTCLECGGPLGAGRSDRKFCNDVCRTAFNNKRRAGSLTDSPADDEADSEQRSIDRDAAAVQRVQQILLSNRAILCNVYELYERRVSYIDFMGHGINIKYFTSEYKDDDGYRYRMCFDYGYRLDGEVVYLIYNGGELHFN